MNIIVKPYAGASCYCRPDTTWERENKDFYVPTHVERLLWAPVVFARVGKAGKHIGQKFASRYYDAVGFGALMYGGEEEIAFSSCLDHTSILPSPLYNPVVLENPENAFEVVCNDENVARYAGPNFRSLIEEAVCAVSKRVSLRIGDMVAVELDAVRLLAERQSGETKLAGRFCENQLFDLKLIF